jgi:hypothetical protein
MIRYALKCGGGHRFDSWFQSAAAFDALEGAGHLSCAVCGDANVEKAVMAPRVATGETAPAPAAAPPAPADRPLAGPSHPAEQMLRALREHVEKHSTYVGGRFAAEARAMHLGERDAGAIHGEATPEEARSLLEDGVPIAPLPILPRSRPN